MLAANKQQQKFFKKNINVQTLYIKKIIYMHTRVQIIELIQIHKSFKIKSE